MIQSAMWIRRAFLTLVLLAALPVLTASPARAETDPAENLEVLKDTGRDLRRGMKAMSKGLGVRCRTCHVQGNLPSDKKDAKRKTRAFFEKAVASSDDKARRAALLELLEALSLKTPRDEPLFWKGIDSFQKQP